MSVEFRSKAAIMRLLSLINEYTGSVKASLTEAVAELMKKSKRGYTLVSSICNSTIEEITAEDFGAITSVAHYLFRNNTNLRYAQLPRGITSIGQNCFDGCINLDMPYIPDGVEIFLISTFYNCKKLSVTKLPDNLKRIDSTVFYNCESLRISEIPVGVTEIGRGAFSGCKAIESITFRGKPSSIDRSAFNNCSKLTVINVPWAEGAVSNAPWGASNAVINYNYKE